jgi:hypothetical protein
MRRRLWPAADVAFERDRGTAVGTSVCGVRMLIIIADPANVDGAEVTYTGTGKWFEYDENGVSTGNSFSSDPVPIPKGSFLALPTDGLTVMRGVITTPASSKAYIITKT